MNDSIRGTGRVTDATVRVMVITDDETKLQVDYGHEETALIGLWQVVR
jgi:ABC-type transporter MlaC component